MSISCRCLTVTAWLLLTAAAASAQQKPQAQLRGFGVVLLEGSQQAGGSSDLPATASAAIADIKDFLPFKSYRLLDSSWTLGSNALQEYTSRLQGGSQEFQVRIGSKVEAASSNVEVKFTLTEGGHLDVPFVLTRPAQQSADARRQSLAKEDANTASLEAELAALLQKGAAPPQGVADLRARIQESRDRAATIRRQVQANGGTNSGTWDTAGGLYFRSRGALIDTSFTMRIGETVVVGTSRVGGDKALIVLLSAVPASAKP